MSARFLTDEHNNFTLFSEKHAVEFSIRPCLNGREKNKITTDCKTNLFIFSKK